MLRATILLLSLAVTPFLAGGEVAVPFEIDERFGSILVRIEVNGKPATLLVDTGAASTFVSAELAGVDASALGRSRFRADGGMEVSGIWDRAKIALGAWRVSLEVKVIEMTTVSQRYGRRIDGLLGQDVLRRFERVTIDFGAKRLVLSEGE